MKTCKKCQQAAAITLPRYGLSLCATHFMEFMETRVKKIIQKYKMVNPYEKVAVALSGGKDSAVLFHLMDSIYGETLELLGVHINLGIESANYSKTAQEVSHNLCTQLNREFYCLDLKREYEISMEMVKEREKILKRPLCGVCGTFKRYLLNRYSLNLGCEKLATGHVLDDEVSVLFMNLINGNMDQLVRTGPNLVSQTPTMITRIKPLYEISEFETLNYAQLTYLQLQTDECPYSTGASSLKYKAFLQDLENAIPGIDNVFLQNYNKKMLLPLKQYYQKQEDLIKKCKECKGPSSQEICAFCNIKNLLKRHE